MPNQWKIDLSEYGISDAATQELRFFCFRYSEMKSELARLHNSQYLLHPTACDNMPHGPSPGDPTANAGDRAVKLSADCEAIEQAAAEADPDAYRWLLDAVTKGLTYTHELAKGFPFEEKRFYRGRRELFHLLAIKKKII